MKNEQNRTTLQAMNRAKELAQIVKEHIGIDIFSTRQFRALLTCRKIVVSQMLSENYSQVEVAGAIGKDRATVAGYQKYIAAAREFPAMFPDIIRTDEILSPYFTAGIKKEAAL